MALPFVESDSRKPFAFSWQEDLKLTYHQLPTRLQWVRGQGARELKSAASSLDFLDPCSPTALHLSPESPVHVELSPVVQGLEQDIQLAFAGELNL